MAGKFIGKLGAQWFPFISLFFSFFFFFWQRLTEGHVCVPPHLSVFFTACSLFMLFLLIENNLVPFYEPPSEGDRGINLSALRQR